MIGFILLLRAHVARPSSRNTFAPKEKFSSEKMSIVAATIIVGIKLTAKRIESKTKI